jgi:hypothetical protein
MDSIANVTATTHFKQLRWFIELSPSNGLQSLASPHWAQRGASLPLQTHGGKATLSQQVLKFVRVEIKKGNLRPTKINPSHLLNASDLFR